MKKVLTFVLILAMVVGLAACGGGSTPTAEEIYNGYLAKMETVDAFDMDMETLVKAGISGVSSEVKITMNTKVVGANSEDATKMQILMSYEQGGMSMDMAVYYDAGWMYMDVLGMKMKQQASVEEVFDTADAAAMDDMVDAELLKDAVVTKLDDGNYQIDTKLSEAKAKELFADSLSAFGSTEGINFDDIALVMVFDKEYNPVSANVAFATQIEVEGVATDMDMSLTLRYNAFGDAVELTLPSFDDYVEGSY